MKTKQFLLSLLLITGAAVLAQPQTETPKRIADISFLNGFWLNESFYTGPEDFRKLAPNSALVSQDLSKFSNSLYTVNTGGAGINLMSSLRLKNHNTQEFRQGAKLRIGISYRYSNFLSDSYNREERSPHDTLYSSSGAPVFIDTVSQQSVGMNYELHSMSLHAALIWETDPSRRFSFYGGVGASVDHAIRARSIIHEHNFGYLTSDDERFRHDQRDSHYGDMQQDEVENKLSFGFGAYAPLGVNWSLGPQNTWLSRWHLFLEWRPGMDFRNIPELELVAKFHSFQGIGLKYSFS